MFDKKSVKVPIVYSEAYYVEIGDHVFPTSKYRLIKKALEKDESLTGKFDIVAPCKARNEDVLTVHDADYVCKLESGELGADEVYALEMPLSKELVDAAFITCGGTITAGRRSLESSLSKIVKLGV